MSIAHCICYMRAVLTFTFFKGTMIVRNTLKKMNSIVKKIKTFSERKGNFQHGKEKTHSNYLPMLERCRDKEPGTCSFSLKDLSAQHQEKKK